MASGIALGNASYGFREYTLPEFFAASHEVGLTSVEIDCGWLEEESSNKITVDATPQDLDAVQRMAEEAGVKVTALGGGAVVGLSGDVAEDRCDELMKVIDLADALDARVIRVFTEHDFTHSKHYVLPAERVTDALYETLSTAFNKIGRYAEAKNVALAIENHGGHIGHGRGRETAAGYGPLQVGGRYLRSGQLRLQRVGPLRGADGGRGQGGLHTLEGCRPTGLGRRVSRLR